VNIKFDTYADTIHFFFMNIQVKISRVGVETTRVCQRLQELINWMCYFDPTNASLVARRMGARVKYLNYSHYAGHHNGTTIPKCI